MRFAHLSGHVIAIKETLADLAKREYDMLHQAFDWDDGVFATLNRTALDAAFCDADTKDKIAKRLEAAHV